MIRLLRVHSVFRVILLVVANASLLCGLNTANAQAPKGTDRVNCLDVERQTVRRSRADQCQGRIIDDLEAGRIAQQRRDYIAKSLKGAQETSIVGKRLARVGAGVVVNSQGFIITNAHVAAGCADLAISAPNGTVSHAKLIAARANQDLALLKGDGSPIGVAEFTDQSIVGGEPVFIVGYPNQGLPPLIPLLTEGRLALAPGNGRAALPFEAPVRPGNSGGPVLNSAGQVVGIVFAAADTSKIYQEQKKIVRDKGFAIPISMVRQFLGAQGVAADFRSASQTNLDPYRLLEMAREYVVRVECWN